MKTIFYVCMESGVDEVPTLSAKVVVFNEDQGLTGKIHAWKRPDLAMTERYILSLFHPD